MAGPGIDMHILAPGLDTDWKGETKTHMLGLHEPCIPYDPFATEFNRGLFVVNMNLCIGVRVRSPTMLDALRFCLVPAGYGKPYLLVRLYGNATMPLSGKHCCTFYKADISKDEVKIYFSFNKSCSYFNCNHFTLRFLLWYGGHFNRFSSCRSCADGCRAASVTTQPFVVFDKESEIESYLQRDSMASRCAPADECTKIQAHLLDVPRTRLAAQESARMLPEALQHVKTEDGDASLQLPPKKRLRCGHPERDASPSCDVPLPPVKPEPVEQDEVGLNPAAYFMMSTMFGLSAEYMLDGQSRVSFFKHTREDVPGADFHQHILRCTEDDMNREISFESCHANVMASSSLSGHKAYTCEEVVRDMHEAVRAFMRDDGGSIRDQERDMVMGPYAS